MSSIISVIIAFSYPMILIVWSGLGDYEVLKSHTELYELLDGVRKYLGYSPNGIGDGFWYVGADQNKG
jgi:hypothetical protein